MNDRSRRSLTVTLIGIVFGGVIDVRALTEPKNDFRFSIIGDRTGGNVAGVYEKVWKAVDALRPDFVINVGDTIQRVPDQHVRSQWDALRPLFHRYRHYPLYFTPGNHDVFSETSERIYQQETRRPTFYSFNYQDAHFTVLDNSRTSELSELQLRYLERDLGKHRNQSPKFVFFHKPFWILPLRFGSGEFPLHRLARKYGVDYIISGHGHQFMRLERDGIVYMEVGSSGGRMRGVEHGQGFEKGWFHHHVWTIVERHKVAFIVKEIGAPFGQGREFRARDWGEDGPAFDVTNPPAMAIP